MEISEFKKNHKSLSKKEIIDFVLEHQQEDLPTNILGIVFERVYINPSTGQTDGEVCVATLQYLLMDLKRHLSCLPQRKLKLIHLRN